MRKDLSQLLLALGLFVSSVAEAAFAIDAYHHPRQFDFYSINEPLAMAALPVSDASGWFIADIVALPSGAAQEMSKYFYSRNGSTADVDQLVDTLGVVGTTCSLMFLACYVLAALLWLPQWHPGDSTAHHHHQSPQRSNSSFSQRAVQMFARVAVSFVWRVESLCTTTAVADKKDNMKAQKGEVQHQQPRFEHHRLRHLAVIMDGNRRYGRLHHRSDSGVGSETIPSFSRGSISNLAASAVQGDTKKIGTASSGGIVAAARGHKAGGEKLLEFISWCIEMEIPIVTVYAFSSENWNRSPAEIDLLMGLFEAYFQKIRLQAREKRIRIRYICTEPERLPPRILELMKAIEIETARMGFPARLAATDGLAAVDNDTKDTSSLAKIVVNVCVSYGSRSEIVQACRQVVDHAMERARKNCESLSDHGITEESFMSHLCRPLHSELDRTSEGLAWNPEWASPDVLLRTSGEQRISNFLMYQCAYSELVFVQKAWPEMERSDLLATVNEFCRRHRRFGV